MQKPEETQTTNIALCHRGEPGLVTHYILGKARGIHLSPAKFGQPWQSEKPKMVEPFLAKTILAELSEGY